MYLLQLNWLVLFLLPLELIVTIVGKLECDFATEHGSCSLIEFANIWSCECGENWRLLRRLLLVLLFVRRLLRRLLFMLLFVRSRRVADAIELVSRRALLLSLPAFSPTFVSFSSMPLNAFKSDCINLLSSIKRAFSVTFNLRSCNFGTFMAPAMLSVYYWQFPLDQ